MSIREWGRSIRGKSYSLVYKKPIFDTEMKQLLEKIKGLDQLVFWLFIFMFVFDYHFLEDNWGEAIKYTSLEVSTYAFIVYTNYLLLIPFFLKKRRFILYVLSAVLLAVVYVFVIRYTGIEQILYEWNGWRNIFSMLINTTLFLLISTLYWYYQQWHLEKEQRLTMRSEKLEAELNFLKTQFSPHFIFNTLNNIYSLVIQKHENAAPMIAKLSTILRYVLYECSEDNVLLKQEVNALENYIGLHLLRKPKSENIDFYKEGKIEDVKIAPLLLINFVENCFKHSDIDKNEAAWIKVSCIVDGEILHFATDNSKDTVITSKSEGGIGLENVKRQLALHYPDRHQIEIQEEPQRYKVDLKIKLV